MSGILEIIALPFGYLFGYIYGLAGNYIVALLLFSVIIKAAFIPFEIKQRKNTVRKMELYPKEQRIRSKYEKKSDQESQLKMQQEVMAMYKAENFNPLGGMLPVLMQLPIFFALYYVITNPLKYISRLNSETIEAASERAQALIANVPSSETIFGRLNGILPFLKNGAVSFTQIDTVNIINAQPEAFSDLIGNAILPDFIVLNTFDLSQTPSISALSWLVLIPVLASAVTYFSQIITQKLTLTPEMRLNEENGAMKKMMLIGPIMSLWISFSVPGAIGVYWMFQSALSIVLQRAIARLIPFLPRKTKDKEKVILEDGMA